MRTITILLSFLIFNSLVFSQEFSPKKIKKHVSYLASDKLKGRGTSSKEEILVAEYISSQFKKLDLKPMGSSGYYFDFTFRKNPNPHDTSTQNIQERKGRNVLAFLDNSAENTIVIGAHHDHLGLGNDFNSLDANPSGKIHNGADDNASGVSGVLALAEYLSTNKTKEKYNFLFMTFSGEELGLIGSKKWCDNPTYPLSKINCMINLDMIGRLNDSTKKLMVYGIGTSPAFDKMIDATFSGQFSVKKDSAGIGPSDQTSFYLKDIPVLHFFTGQHSDYHKPEDDAEKINYNGMTQILSGIVRLLNSVDEQPKLVFLKTRTIENKSAKWKVTMGVMPDYTFEGKGMRIDGVTDGKPASKAGLKKGDILIEMGGDSVENVETYMKALSKFNKGDSTEVKIKRESEMLNFKINF